jgi:putative DNA primase/helicase
MSPSSVDVTYRPTGPGHRARTARVDLTRIPDPETWLTNRLGRLASFEIRHVYGAATDAPDPSDAQRLDALASSLTASMQAILAIRRAVLNGLAVRLVAAAPAGLQQSATPNPTKEK